MTTTVPTLLVGLGGIGSDIVERVYKLIPKDKREGIAVHAFDTNINDINDRKFLKDNITQTSTNITVGQYLDHSDESIKEWFPHEIQLLKRKTMTDGAGQIRSVSRLAYHAAMRDGKLNDLEKQIGKVFKPKGEKNDPSVRIMIVSSMAGGTGAGIFLQTALYLRELLEKKLKKNSVLVRGAFLLPDILVHTNTIPDNQSNSVRTNAYACFKELDAITKIADNQSIGHQTVNLEFEYRPDQVDVEGRQAFTITKDHLPYDFCFLYDYLTNRGEQIEKKEYYIEQMVMTIYLQLFSPISNQNFSIEDNFILDLIKGRGGNRYCGAGSSRLIYPYDDIVEYCALKWAEESISSEWRKIDEDLEEELLNYEKDLNAGIQRQEPEKEKRYVELIKNYAKGNQPHPFFTRIYMSTLNIDENGREIGSKINKFIDAVTEQISQILYLDEKFRQYEENCHVDRILIRDREKAESEVEEMEINLEIYKNYIYRMVHEQKNYIVNQIIGEDCQSSEGLIGDDDYRLNVWILRRPEPLHPIAVRYFLYSLKNIFDVELNSLNKINSEQKKGIDNYAKPNVSDNNYETPVEKVINALEQGVVKRVFHNKFKSVIKDYESRSNQQLQTLKSYALNYLKELVFSELNKNISTMIEDWDYYFRNLKGIQTKLKNEIIFRANEHDRNSDPTKIFIFASKTDKESLWKEVRTSLSYGSKLPSDISKRIYVNQNNLFCSRRYNKAKTNQSDKMEIENRFRSDVIDWYRLTIKKHEEININVLMALKKQIEKNNKNYQEIFKETISIIDNLAQPYIYSTSKNAEAIAHWGIHPSSLGELTEDEINEFFGEGIISDTAFSIYEIIRYRSINGIYAEEIPAFSAGSGKRDVEAGSYFRAYKERIRQMKTSAEITITPHLDKRWHLQAYMPDLNQKLVKADHNKTEKAFILGLIHKRLMSVTRDSVKTWECHTGKEGRKAVMKGGESIREKFFDLYDAVFHNPAHVDSIISNIDKKWDDDIKENMKNGKNGIQNHSFYKGCKKLPQFDFGIINCILYLTKEMPSHDLDEITDRLLKRTMDLISMYYVKVYGEKNKITANKDAKNFIQQLFNESEVFNNAKNENSYVYERWSETKDIYTKN